MQLLDQAQVVNFLYANVFVIFFMQLHENCTITGSFMFVISIIGTALYSALQLFHYFFCRTKKNCIPCQIKKYKYLYS